jgi:hypothetical protein
MGPWIAVDVLGFDVQLWQLILSAIVAAGGAVGWLVKTRRARRERSKSRQTTIQAAGQASFGGIHYHYNIPQTGAQGISTTDMQVYALLRRAQIAEKEGDMEKAKECYDRILEIRGGEAGPVA